nr:NAD(P)/FAD-dependent oxidoreductase [Kibdelosporangium sp. MJ126-NF4]CEL14614.1 Beta-carotene ketolase [Kibdelosporangium sp. MJ126-NF4]CTQ96757.1 Beta-carotene ketolase (EC 1.14.-.-) [Kibdelosporangium sp. MJ126-NF4]
MNDAEADAVDAVVVGGGHNGLVAAAYLARAGLSVLVLERRAEVGGAAVSFRAFESVDVRLSRYSYLVSLFPREIIDDLGLRIELRKRRVSSYTPVGSGGIVADDPASLGADAEAWQRFYAMTASVAARVFPTMTEPLPSRSQLRERVDDDHAWNALFERPLHEVIESTFTDDTVRGIVLTDALIGTFAPADDPMLRQNRCFLYHVIGGGTGDWDVPVGGMGAVTAELARAAREAGARIATGAEVTAIDPGGAVTYRTGDGERTVAGGHILANVSPDRLAALLGETPDAQPEGAQLKVNMVLRRLPRLKDSRVDPQDAFAGTFHVNESYQQLATAYREAADGRIPSLPPCEIYCHSLTDPSILGAAERAAGMQTLTLFGLHMPARLFRADNDKTREQALRATLRSLDSVLAEPIADCVLPGCVEAKTPVDLENELGLPAGHIFHRDLSWPYADDGQEGTWGVETEHDRVLLCGAGARRGGGVSGIPGHNAAMAVLRSR